MKTYTSLPSYKAKDILNIPVANATVSKNTLAKFKGTYESYSEYLYNCDSGYAAFFGCNTLASEYTASGALKKTTQYFEKAYYCHRYWTDAANKGHTDGMITIFSKLCRPKINKAFLDFVLAADGPWGIGLRHSVVIRDDDGVPTALMMLNSDKTNVKIFTNAVIATRLTTGHGLDWVWYRLVELGFTEEVAFVLMHLFRWGNHSTIIGRHPSELFGNNPEKRLPLTYKDPVSSDMPLTFAPEFNPCALVKHRPLDDPKATIAEGVKPNPCNDIWFTTRKVDNYNHRALLERQISSVYPEHQYNDVNKLTDMIMGKSSNKSTVENINYAMTNGYSVLV